MKRRLIERLAALTEQVRSLQASTEIKARKIPITTEQRQVLETLEDSHRTSASDLAKKFGAGVNRLLAALENAGLVARRLGKVVITPDGSWALAHAKAAEAVRGSHSAEQV